MNPRAPVELGMMSDPLYLCGARELVASLAERFGFSDECCCRIKLAVDEALANVIRHGYHREFDKPIWLRLEPLPSNNGFPIGGIRIVIEDEADQVDPKIIKSRDLDEVRPGGLGVHIIKEIMDEVVYEKRERVGMRLTMVKRLDDDDARACCRLSQEGGGRPC